MPDIQVQINDRGGVDFRISESLNAEETKQLLNNFQRINDTYMEYFNTSSYDDEMMYAFDWALANSIIIANIGGEELAGQISVAVNREECKKLEDKLNLPESERGKYSLLRLQVLDDYTQAEFEQEDIDDVKEMDELSLTRINIDLYKTANRLARIEGVKYVDVTNLENVKATTKNGTVIRINIPCEFLHDVSIRQNSTGYTWTLDQCYAKRMESFHDPVVYEVAEFARGLMRENIQKKREKTDAMIEYLKLPPKEAQETDYKQLVQMCRTEMAIRENVEGTPEIETENKEKQMEVKAIEENDVGDDR